MERGVAGEEELEFLGCGTCGLAHLHCRADLVGPEFGLQGCPHLLEFVDAALCQHLEGKHQVGREVGGEFIEVGFASLRVVQPFGFLLAQFCDFEVGDAEACLLDCVDDFAEVEVGVGSDEDESSGLGRSTCLFGLRTWCE